MMVQPKPPDKPCPNCEVGTLVPHRSAGKGQYKEYPNLLICEKCWHKYDPQLDGSLVLVRNPRHRKARHLGR